MTLAEFVEQYKDVPITGTFLRPEFNKFNFGGIIFEFPGVHCVIATLNYLCLDTYSDTQRVEVHGVYLNVYIDRQRSESVVIHDLSEIEKVIPALAIEASALCDHNYGRELNVEECQRRGIAHHGNCWHVYECGKCKKFFSVDSSG